MVHDHAHNHDHSGGHAHDHGHAAVTASAGRLAPALVLTLAFVGVEALAGWFAHSLALMSDAGHNLADAAALGLSWYAVWIARRPAHAGMTFGYHRVGILAALINAVTLVVISLGILWEGIRRLQAPTAVHSAVMIGVAAVAFVLNLVISVWLHGGRHDLNVRSAYVHMIGDAVASLGVVGAGIVVATTGSSLADPVVSLLIAALILWSSWGILRESVTVLLEGTPAGLDMARVEQTIRAVGGVQDVHDLHVWTISSGIVACSCHVLIDKGRTRAGQTILHEVSSALGHRFGIWHATVQIEVDSCESAGMYCDLTTGRTPRLRSTH
ncbi:MAG TPA: cation diffusion facilitator family transporter [Vicinamibacterales bacterium]|nr:cation diffusion facilitator family transporter [Vicinamibacterales bacterium]